jgi:hypothetical protein
MFVITGEDCSDLQHLRAAHVHRRWPGRQQLRRSGNNKIKKFVYPYASLACMLLVSHVVASSLFPLYLPKS